MHQLHIKVEVEHLWTPRRVRQNDVLLMDEIMKYNLTSSQLCSINYCRIYLQVLLLSNITTADGRPAWSMWRLALGYI
jgi:hypothetical protein